MNFKHCILLDMFYVYIIGMPTITVIQMMGYFADPSVHGKMQQDITY